MRLSLPDLAGFGGDGGHGVAGVDDEVGGLGQGGVVHVFVGGGDEDAVVALDGGGVEGNGFAAGEVGVLAGLADDGEVVVVVVHHRAAGFELLHEDVGGGLAVVVDVRLVGEAEDEDPGAFDGLGAVVEGLGHAVDHPVGHGGVDLAGELDELGVLPELARLPGEVEGVDGNAVAAEAGARPEGHEAEGLGGRRGDDLPDVDAHGLVDLLELVDQGDVHAAEGVLGDLGGLGGAAAAHGHEGVDGLGVELGDGLKAGGGVAADDLGDAGDDAVRVARVLALGAEGQVEVGAGLEAAALFEHGAELAVRGAGVGGGFQADEHPLVQVRGDGAARVGDVGDVRLAVLVQRRGHADDDGLDIGADREVVGGAEVAAPDLLGDALGGDVLDVALAGVHGLHLAAIHVDARNIHPRTGELQAERQAHVTQANNGDFVHDLSFRLMIVSNKTFSETFLSAKPSNTSPCPVP